MNRQMYLSQHRLLSSNIVDCLELLFLVERHVEKDKISTVCQSTGLPEENKMDLN